MGFKKRKTNLFGKEIDINPLRFNGIAFNQNKPKTPEDVTNKTEIE